MSGRGVVDCESSPSSRPRAVRLTLGATEDVKAPDVVDIEQRTWRCGKDHVGCRPSLLFTTPESAHGTAIEVFDSCYSGTCTCIHLIGGVVTQLKPCRIASHLFTPGFMPSVDDMTLFNGLVDGFNIVDGDVMPYERDNYASILSDKNHSRMTNILNSELAEGMVSFSDGKPKCIHSLGAVSKSDGGMRPITDCSRPHGRGVNNYQDSLAAKFVYKSVDDVVNLMRGDEYMSVVDIKGAFRSVCINPLQSDLQGFKWDFRDGLGDRYLVDHRLCFGLRCGPYYFNLISNFVSRVLSSKYGLRIVNYLDDFLVMSNSQEGCQNAQRVVIGFLRYMGFHISWKKLQPPSKVTVYLGIEIDSSNMSLSLPVGKLNKLSDVLKAFTGKTWASKKQLERLAGMLSHCSVIVRGGRTFSRRVYNLCKKASKVRCKMVRLNSCFRADLQWWFKFAAAFNGKATMVKDRLCLQMTSDSSKKGFAVYLGDKWLAGTWDNSIKFQSQGSGCCHIAMAPAFDSYDPTNINELELWPVLRGLQEWGVYFKDMSVDVVTDNTQVFDMIRTGRSRNITCMTWLREIFWLCFLFNCDLKPVYIRSEDNFVADTLSRLGYDKYRRVLTGNWGKFDICCGHDLLNYCIVNSS